MAQVATAFGVGWATVMAAVGDHGVSLVEDTTRLQGWVDETAFLWANAHRYTQFVTGVVDELHQYAQYSQDRHRRWARGDAVQFDEFFVQATRQSDGPYDYQKSLAHNGLPPVLQAPTGAGKSAAVVLAWLWRRHRHPDPAVRAATPRRLVLALPMRVLVDQSARAATGWVAQAGLGEVVDVHVIMGGQPRSQQHEWRRDLHRSSIVIGTADMVVSKLLVRAYGASRASYPWDFAMLGNGSHVVLDEIQLMPEAAGTLRQVAAFARRWPTVEPFGVTLMSATVDPRTLDTVDNPWLQTAAPVSITEADRGGTLRVRLEATRQVEELTINAEDWRTLAVEVTRLHNPGTRTLVVVNTVAAATDLYRALERTKPSARLVLVHSRFRPAERAARTDELLADPDDTGTIVVATQVIEAGVDLDSTVLITQAAPWPSIVQRAGRCNRAGLIDGARLLWFEVGTKSTAPYDTADVAASAGALRLLEGALVTGEQLAAQDVAVVEVERSILRGPDFLGLFDTAPDLSGADVDVSPYIRSGDDLDVRVAWVDMPMDGPDLRSLPPARAQCPVPLGALRAWAIKRNVRLWTLDGGHGVGAWRTLDPRRELRPGMVLVVDVHAGGYSPELGFTPTSTAPVEPVPDDDVNPLGEETEGTDAEPGSTDQPGWVTLSAHLDDTAAHAQALLAALGHPLAPDDVGAVVAAAQLHDLGKAAVPWADALLNLAPSESRPGLTELPYAKSAAGRGRLRVAQRPGFRHELVTALLLAAHPTEPVSFLVRYLVAAHHGRIRLQARDATTQANGQLFGLKDGESLALYPLPPLLPGLGAKDTLEVNLGALSLGGETSWTRDALGLLDHYGPFVLAYLETLVRAADWRSSAGCPLAEEGS